MSKPKAEIRQVKKNHYGFPTVLARSAIGSFEFAGNVYDQVHICANVSTGELTLRSTAKPYASRPQEVGCTFMTKEQWKSHDAASLLEFVNGLIAAFKAGKIPNDMRLLPVRFGVLV